MSQIDALQVTRNLKSRMVEFALDDNFVRDPEIRQALEALWSGSAALGGLSSDLWVEGAFPSKAATATLGDLAAGGIIHPRFAAQLDQSGAFPLDRYPYLHQARSIDAARTGYQEVEKPAIVVSAGTGAGKTESFLIPMLDDIFRIEAVPGQGVSAIILYPMNALVNDQIERLEEWLKGQNIATFFHFTSESPETVRDANKRGLTDTGPHRFRSRQHARGREGRTGGALQNGPVPRVLVTNYSMLEYMLCRPQDSVFFGSNLRSIVLDEAHLYTGNLAAEISLLLRRVYERCQLACGNVLHYATSATISSAADPERELKGFCAKLFGKPPGRIEVILGEKVESPIPADCPRWTHDASLASSLAASPWPEGLAALTSTQGAGTVLLQLDPLIWSQTGGLLQQLCQGDPADLEALLSSFSESREAGPLLNQFLARKPVFAFILELLRSRGRLPLAALAAETFGGATAEALEATRRLLALGAMARPSANAYPLLPNRIHYLIRGSQGISVSFDPDCAPCAEAKIGDRLYLFSPSSRESEMIRDASATLTLAQCRESGEVFVAGRQVGMRLEEVPLSIVLGYDATPNTLQALRYLSLREVPGADHLGFNPQTGELDLPGPGLVDLWERRDRTNPSTGEPIHESIGFFARQSRLQLALLSEAALMEMPPFPGASSRWKPAQGRRLLIFSDSRTEAARLGPRFTRQHELQLVRAAIAEILEESNRGGSRALDLIQSNLAEQQERLEQMDADDPGREFIEEEIERYSSRLQQAQQGETMERLLQRLKKSPRIFELFDREFGRRHWVTPDDLWTQQAWEKNRDNVAADLLPFLAGEFARRTLWPSVTLETAGLAEVIYYGLDDWTPPHELRAGLAPGVDLQLSSLWPDFLRFLLDAIRTNGAITLGSRELDQAYEYDGALIGRYLSLDARYLSMVIPLRSAQQRSKVHTFTAGLLRRCGLDESSCDIQANHTLKAAFEQLYENAAQLGWLRAEIRQVDNGVDARTIQIVFPRLGLRQPRQHFRCNRTGQIWPRATLGTYPGSKYGELVEASNAELDADPRVGRVRRELKESPIFRYGLWAEEHSAQLDPRENKRIQDLFKQGVRNILSSTTTLELGIDIGGLNGVLMGNIPPGKANYLQRAGRAGRRADGSSLVLGFARSTPYERQVFLNFGAYLDAPLREPTIFLDREEIVWRHLRAHLLGHFFNLTRLQGQNAGAMNAFGKMGPFCGMSEIPLWQRGQQKPPLPPPNDLLMLPFASGRVALADHFLAFLEIVKTTKNEHHPLLARIAAGNEVVCAQLAGHWEASISAIKAIFERAITEWRQDYQQLVTRWNDISPAVDEALSRAACMSICHQARTFFGLTVIESLGDRLVIPRYGFPIGLSRLRVTRPDGVNQNVVREEDQFRLQRSSMLAIREYVPGSKLIVGGELVTSRGLLKHWTGNDINNHDATLGLRAWFARSEAAGFFAYDLTRQPDSANPPPGLERGEMLFAKYGFTTAAWDPPRVSQAYETVGRVSSYSIAFQGDPAGQEILPDYAGIPRLEARYRSAGELIVMNSGADHFGFAVCTKCGYADSEAIPNGNGRLNLPRNFLWHASLFRSDERRSCWSADETPVLRNQHLSARQTTHLVLFDLSPWLQVGDPDQHRIANTLAQCLRLAGCELRQLDYREVSVLGVTASPRSPAGLAIVLYDSVAGGSGHVFEMLQALQRHWWERAANLLRVPDGTNEVRARAMIRRILTSDSPVYGGVPQFAPLEAERLFSVILGASSWVQSVPDSAESPDLPDIASLMNP